MLPIHRRVAEAFTSALLTIARVRIRGIHRSALRLGILALASHVRAALRLTHALRPWAVAIPACLRAGLVRPCWRRIRLRRCGWWKLGCRWLVGRFGFLGLQWYNAESESTAKPGELVGFEFHTECCLD